MGRLLILKGTVLSFQGLVQEGGFALSQLEEIHAFIL